MDSTQDSRRTERAHLEKVVCIRLQKSNHAIVLNLSDQGLAFHSVFPITEGGTIPFSFVKPNGERKETIARLAWIDDTKRNGGLQFDLTRPSMQADIMHWVAHVLTNEQTPLPQRQTERPAPPPVPVQSPAANGHPTPYPTGTQRFRPEQPALNMPPSVTMDERRSAGISAAGRDDGFYLPSLKAQPAAPRVTLPGRLPSPPLLSYQEQDLQDSPTPHRAKLSWLVGGAAVVALLVVAQLLIPWNPVTVAWSRAIGRISENGSVPQSVPAPAPQAEPQTAPQAASAAPDALAKSSPQAQPASSDPAIQDTPKQAPPDKQPAQPSSIRTGSTAAAPDTSATSQPTNDRPGGPEFAEAKRYLNPGAQPGSIELAVPLLWVAVGKGNVEAEIALAGLFERGEGVPKNCDQAWTLLIAAAEKHSAEAQRELDRGCQ